MSLFKKDKALYIETMDVLKGVTVAPDKVRFTLNWSNIELNPEDVPKLLSDVIQLYAMVKPTLDSKTEANKEKSDQPLDEPDLSSIPF